MMDRKYFGVSLSKSRASNYGDVMKALFNELKEWTLAADKKVAAAKLEALLKDLEGNTLEEDSSFLFRPEMKRGPPSRHVLRGGEGKRS